MKGRKRHIAVDTEGILIAVLVHAADLQDRAGGLLLLAIVFAMLDTVRKIWFDAGYSGDGIRDAAVRYGFEAEVVRRSDDREHGRWTEAGAPPLPAVGGFEVLPRRWVVERTFAWLCRYRRLSKDYEALTETSEAFCWLASLRTLTARLAR